MAQSHPNLGRLEPFYGTYKQVITNRGGLLRINFIVQKIKTKKPTRKRLK